MVKRSHARRARALTARFYCIFCAGPLRRGLGARLFRCGRCKAVFAAERNQRGCVIGVRVRGCGTPQCCRLAR